MAILLSSANRVVVCNPTGRYASPLIAGMKAAGTRIVAGVSPGRAGSTFQDIPIFDTVPEAVAGTACDTAVVFVPAAGAGDAIVENADAGIALQMVAAEYVPTLDAIASVAYARSKNSWVIGPNSLGLLNPGVGMLGGIALDFAAPGPIGVLSRSGTLLLTVTRMLTRAGLGQSTAVSIGGDGVIGRRAVEYVLEMERDPGTEAIVLLGEIGGQQEYEVAAVVRSLTKPVIALVVGRHAPAGTQLGHAGAMIAQQAETAKAKCEALRAAGCHVADSPHDVVQTAARLLGWRK